MAHRLLCQLTPATQLPAATAAPAKALLVRMQGMCRFASLLCPILTDEDHEDEHGLGEIVLKQFVVTARVTVSLV